jgi:hypothetical protein
MNKNYFNQQKNTVFISEQLKAIGLLLAFVTTYNRKLKSLFVFLFLSAPFFSFAQVDLVQWNGSTDLVPTIINNYIVASDVTGAGFSNGNPTPTYDGIEGTNWTTANSINLSKYFQITLNPILDGRIVLNEIQFTYKGGSASYQVWYSKQADFSNPVNLATVNNANIYNTPTSGNLTGLNIAINAGEKFFIRFYAFNGNGVWKLMNNNLLKLKGTIVQNPSAMSGTYYIGSGTYTGCSSVRYFPTITTAVSALNMVGVSGEVNFLLDNSLYNRATNETFPIVINSYTGNDTNKVTFKPNVGKTVTIESTNFPSSTSTPAVFKINGADNIVFDGSNNGSTTQDLTIYNNNPINPKKAVIWIASQSASNGANNIQIKNLNLKQNYRDDDLSIGVFAGGNGSIGDAAQTSNSKNVIQNVNFIKVGQAIYVNGLSSALSSDWKIQNNTIGGTDNTNKPFAGVILKNSKDYEVSGNTIVGLLKNLTNGAGEFHSGVIVSGTSNGVIFNNTIADIYDSTHNTYCAGIYIDSGNNTIYNNFISNVRTDATDDNDYNYNYKGHGIYLNSGASNKIYYNTIVMNATTAGGRASCLYIANGSTIDVQNNIFHNTQTTGNQYTIFANVNSSPFAFLNNNNHYVGNNSSKFNARINGNPYVSLADWQLVTGKDSNSKNTLPTFVSTTDFHLQDVSGNSGLSGTTISGITADIDGQSRVKPYMGADEVSCVPIIKTLATPATLYVGGSLNPIVPAVIVSGSAVTSSGWQLETAVGSGAYNSLTVPYTVAFADNGKKIRYTVTNSCGTTNSNSVVISVTNSVDPTTTLTLTSASGTDSQMACINTPITNITYSTTGATGANVTGLPTGISYSWSGNLVTISGTPTVAGTALTYTVTLTSGCGVITATGTIAVNTANTITRTSVVATTAQSVCTNSPITNITYSTTGATGATVTGLPTGVIGSWLANVVTISGTPTVSASVFSYTVTLEGGCGLVTTTGTITVKSDSGIISLNGAVPTGATVTYCPANLAIFRVPAVSGATYTWEVPTGWKTEAGVLITAPITSSSNELKVITGTVSNNVTVTVNSLCPSNLYVDLSGITPGAPVFSKIDPSCLVSKGEIKVTTPGSGIQYTLTSMNPMVVSSSNDLGDFKNLLDGQYSLNSQSGSGCVSAAVSIAIIPQVTKTWTAGAWSPAGAPTVDEKVIFADPYNGAGPINACSCEVNAAVTITSGILNVANGLTVSGSGSLTFDEGAYLVQVNNTNSNTGNITFKLSHAVVPYEYVYWSSPVSGGSIASTFPGYNKSYSYLNNGWVGTNMSSGNGFIVRYASATSQNPNFSGVPNSGQIGPVGSSSGSSLIGNPYPSPIYIDSFISQNAGVLDGSLYFWNPGLGRTISADGTKYEYKGAYTVATATGSVPPTATIAPGVGFFVNGSGFVFNNDMRIAPPTGNSGNFSKQANTKKIAAIEKNRVWLNLTKDSEQLSQLLLGYVSGATNDFDKLYDATTSGGTDFDFYSIDNSKQYTIQGRALPFDSEEQIPLGYKTSLDGILAIGIDIVDGGFFGEAMYLEDKTTNTIHDLSKGSYSFTTAKGEFKDRFVLRYTNSAKLGTNDFTAKDKGAVVSVKNHQIKINSVDQSITAIKVYDLKGSLLYERNKLNNNEFIIDHLASSNQVVIVMTQLENGKWVSQETIFQD